jgi:hypothetical protein
MFVEAMSRISGWIAATPASQTVQSLDGYVPATQSIHIFAIALVMVSAAMLNLRVLGLMNRSLTIVNLATRFRRPLWIGICVLAISGLALLLAEPQRSLVSQVFQLKMLLLVMAIAVTLWLHRTIRLQAISWDAIGTAPAPVRAMALLSMLIWISILFAGRWIAYAQY